MYVEVRGGCDCWLAPADVLATSCRDCAVYLQCVVCRVQSKRHSGFSVVCLLSRWTWTSDPVMVAAALGGGASPKQTTGLGLGGVPASE
jgi:hypothetical protein